MDSWVILVLVLLGALLIYLFIKLNFKKIKVPSVCLITGGVKTGKSLLSVNLATKQFKKNHRSWWWATHLFRKEIEEPYFYTNVQISFGNIRSKKPHRLDRCIKPIEKEHLLRKKRFNYKSVIYIQESSLMADNMFYNNQEFNCDLSLFNKLIAHETKGGSLYYDTQSIKDNHYSMDRVCSSFLYIQKSVNLFLFHVLWVRELVALEKTENNFNEDADFTMRKVIIPFWYHNKYNRYEYSYLTDDLDNETMPYVIHNGVVSFNKLYEKRANACLLKGDNKNNDSK